MKDHDVLFRSIRGIAYISVGPLILLTSSLWFTDDKTAYILAHLAQVYFSVLLFFLCGSIWSFRNYDNNHYKSRITVISLIPLAVAIIGAFFSIFINPAWGILLILVFTFGIRHLKIINSMISLFDDSYNNLFDKISIILCICLVLIFTYWVNPYTYPLKIYN
jgi:ABC-type multidrug transport system permease subunit